MEDKPLDTVDCYVDCWEGSYRGLLVPGVLGTRFAMHRYPFARRVLTINNVDNQQAVLALAEAAIMRGECDEYILVADALSIALERCGLHIADIQSVLHFVDFHLVTVATAQADFILHTAGDVQLTQPFDWVSDAVARLKEDEKLLIANPGYAHHPGLAAKEATSFDDPYWVGFGFSDQCFLGATRRLAVPIYNEWNFLSNRYPMTHIGRIFEARIDAYMRNHQLLRLTDSRVEYMHNSPESEGATHFHGPTLARLAHLPFRFTASVKWRLSGRRVVT